MINNENLAKIAINRSLLKEYNTKESERTVYMNNGDEFEFSIFNSERETIGVKIDINGKSISNSFLVIKPGQRVWLERYIDKAAKFLFSTYEVEDSEEAKQAIENNGEITIRFYRERVVELQPYTYSSNITFNPSPIKTPYWKTSCDIGCEPNIPMMLSAATKSRSFCGTTDNMMSTAQLSCSNTVSNSTIETGRIEKGSKSAQRFNDVEVDFEYWPFKTEYIKILPISRKNINPNDLTKVYCTNCGRKLNTKFKFCPYCGKKTIN